MHKLFGRTVLQTPRLIKLPFFYREVKTLNYGDKRIPRELVYERSDYPLSKIQYYLKNDTIGILGYGPQGKSQALNLRDNE